MKTTDMKMQYSITQVYSMVQSVYF